MVSNSSLEDFKSGNIWKAIEAELKVWLDDIHIELEDLQSLNEDKTFHRLAGNAETVRRCMGIIDILIINNNQDEEEENGKSI